MAVHSVARAESRFKREQYQARRRVMRASAPLANLTRDIGIRAHNAWLYGLPPAEQVREQARRLEHMTHEAIAALEAYAASLE